MNKSHELYRRRQAFKARLKELKLTTHTAAKELHVSRYTIMNWRTGRRPVPHLADMALDAIVWKRWWEFYGKA